MKKYNLITILLLGFSLMFISCEPEQDDALPLGTPPSSVSFDIQPTGDMNTYRLTNTTSGTFIHQWNLGNGQTAEGEEIVITYQFMGTYDITLKAFNDGGFGETTKTITVEEDAPAPCNPGSLMEFVSNCDSKTWTLLPEEGAYWVGPADGSGTTWWMSDAAAVTDRPCAFNDEWIFSSDGVVVYDTKGDVWAEDYMGFNFECVTDGQLPADVAAWGAGTHGFVITEGAVEQIQLIGTGAFIGLPKAANGAEVTSPQPGVTYDVIEKGTVGGQDYMILEVNYVAGIWRFHIVSN